ncbi:hypothetical protein PIB30_017088 [Stylosanthes scabra]|uniref:Subtilisin inhibitor 1 n=1 Tax=Stylosanthes scabra TaxID=79078 RepID=A0ABU6T780_9FABA|nr:hypothetical protein [Stylosanthes scabra]
MAEKDKGQRSDNLPLQQPNEGLLPRSYKELLGSNCPEKTSWPELVGSTSEEAKKKIKEEMSEADIHVIPPGYFVTFDFRFQRVRIFVDESDKIIRTPTIG